MAYYEEKLECERCHRRKMFCGQSGRPSMVAAAKSHGWIAVVGFAMWCCNVCAESKLTKAQRRELAILREHGFCIIENEQRRKVYLELVKKGFAEHDRRSNRPVHFRIAA